MKNTLRYFIAQTRYNFKNAYALKKSFWIGVMSMMLNNLTFFVIWGLFMHTTGPINGWTSLDVFGMLGVSLLTFGIAHSFFQGIVQLPQLVLRGSFDGVLLSPTNIFSKLAGSAFSVTAFGDLFQGILVIMEQISDADITNLEVMFDEILVYELDENGYRVRKETLRNSNSAL